MISDSFLVIARLPQEAVAISLSMSKLCFSVTCAGFAGDCFIASLFAMTGMGMIRDSFLVIVRLAQEAVAISLKISTLCFLVGSARFEGDCFIASLFAMTGMGIVGLNCGLLPPQFLSLGMLRDRFAPLNERIIEHAF